MRLTPIQFRLAHSGFSVLVYIFFSGTIHCFVSFWMGIRFFLRWICSLITKSSTETWLLNSFQDYDLLKSYVSKIQELEGELLCLKNINNSKHKKFVDCVESDDDSFRPKNILFPSINEYSSDYDTKAGDIPGKIWITLCGFVVLFCVIFTFSWVFILAVH